MENHMQMEFRGKQVYVRASGVDRLRKVNAIIFDCDGVLIDVRKSYNRAISETLTYIIRELTGLHIPLTLVSKEIIFLFKKTGGFNNDWDLTYTLSKIILHNMPKEFQMVLTKLMSQYRHEKDVFKRFLIIKNRVRKEWHPNDPHMLIARLKLGLREFASKLIGFRATSIETMLRNFEGFSSSSDYGSYGESIECLLSHPGSVDKSVITRVFEEIFCGPQLFQETYGLPPLFNQQRGLIENEEIIISFETLDALASITNRGGLGIASGRPFQLAEYTLDGLLKKFNPEALIFLDDIKDAEREVLEGMPPDLKKPNPFSLLKASRGLEPFNYALYVGDSMEDLLMSRAANRVEDRFLFAGVYDHSDWKENITCTFLKEGADMILPSVNELPLALKTLRCGKQNEGVRGF